jgi:hypothetical protein
MKWKYGLIKIKHPSVNDEYCELVELFQTDTSGEYNSFCKARINSIEEFNSAYKDIEKDGVNCWFASNGTFSIVKDGNDWEWTPNEGVIASPEEDELYKVYGGD